MESLNLLDKIKIIKKFINYNSKQIIKLSESYSQIKTIEAQQLLLSKINYYMQKNENYMDTIVELILYESDDEKEQQKDNNADNSEKEIDAKEIPINKPKVTPDGKISFKDFISLFVGLYSVALNGDNIEFESNNNEETPSKIHILGPNRQKLVMNIDNFNSLYYVLKDMADHNC